MDAIIDTSHRASAMAFTQGALLGWSRRELAAWIHIHLIRTGRLVARAQLSTLHVHQFPIGVMQLDNLRPPHFSMFGDDTGDDKVGSFVNAARSEVFTSLARFVERHDDSFVQAAIYAGRLTRCSLETNHRAWRVFIHESTNLSDQVLALFAADMLENRADYDDALVVCRHCSKIIFWSDRITPTVCQCHARPSGVRPVVTVPTSDQADVVAAGGTTHRRRHPT